MDIPSRYVASLAALKHNEVNFGTGGIHLFTTSEICDGQIGYSISLEGMPLCGRDEVDGLWRPNWIVIGHDIGLGDPLILDRADPALPVLTAVNGQGTWEPVAIADRVDTFLASLEEFRLISVARTNPVELEANPLAEDERKAFLNRISALNKSGIGVEFWAGFLEG